MADDDSNMTAQQLTEMIEREKQAMLLATWREIIHTHTGIDVTNGGGAAGIMDGGCAGGSFAEIMGWGGGGGGGGGDRGTEMDRMQREWYALMLDPAHGILRPDDDADDDSETSEHDAMLPTSGGAVVESNQEIEDRAFLDALDDDPWRRRVATTALEAAAAEKRVAARAAAARPPVQIVLTHTPMYEDPDFYRKLEAMFTTGAVMCDGAGKFVGPTAADELYVQRRRDGTTAYTMYRPDARDDAAAVDAAWRDVATTPVGNMWKLHDPHMHMPPGDFSHGACMELEFYEAWRMLWEHDDERKLARRPAFTTTERRVHVLPPPRRARRAPPPRRPDARGLRGGWIKSRRAPPGRK